MYVYLCNTFCSSPLVNSCHLCNLLGGSRGVRLVVNLTDLTGSGRTDASIDAFGSPTADMLTKGLPGLCFVHIGLSVGPPKDLLSFVIDLDFCK